MKKNQVKSFFNEKILLELNFVGWSFIKNAIIIKLNLKEIIQSIICIYEAMERSYLATSNRHLQILPAKSPFLSFDGVC